MYMAIEPRIIKNGAKIRIQHSCSDRVIRAQFGKLGVEGDLGSNFTRSEHTQIWSSRDDLGRFGTVSSTIWLDPMRAVRENHVHVNYSHDTFTASRTDAQTSQGQNTLEFGRL